MVVATTPQSGETVRFHAPIGHLGPMTKYPIFHSGYPAAENLTVDWRDVPIRDARTIDGGASLASHGFAVVDFPSRVRDFSDPAAIAVSYAQEIVEIVKSVTGASEVLAPSAGIASRFSDRRGVVARAERAARFSHNDFTPCSTGIHIANEYPEVNRARLNGRIAAYNLWRRITPPPQDMPLALCDPRSISLADLVTAEARYGPPESYGVWGEVALLRFNPAHRWYCFPEMRPNEILIFAGYDSDSRYPSIVPHTAIEDPNCPQDAPSRWNIDIRCYALFD